MRTPAHSNTLHMYMLREIAAENTNRMRCSAIGSHAFAVEPAAAYSRHRRHVCEIQCCVPCTLMHVVQLYSILIGLPPRDWAICRLRWSLTLGGFSVEVFVVVVYHDFVIFIHDDVAEWAQFMVGMRKPGE